jgi:hypothetical protein
LKNLQCHPIKIGGVAIKTSRLHRRCKQPPSSVQKSTSPDG